jgi:hypothetical protein
MTCFVNFALLVTFVLNPCLRFVQHPGRKTPVRTALSHPTRECLTDKPVRRR